MEKILSMNNRRHRSKRTRRVFELFGMGRHVDAEWGPLPSRIRAPWIADKLHLWDVEGRGEEFATELGEVVVRAAAAGRCDRRRRDFGTRGNGTALGVSGGLRTKLA